jgi:hypothetical protein
MGEMGGAQRPILRVNEPKSTGVRSALARMRGKTHLLNLFYLLDYCRRLNG